MLNTTLPRLATSADKDGPVQLLLRQAELVQRVAQLAPSDGPHATPVAGLSLWRLSAPCEPVHAVHQPALCLIVQGAKRLLLADEFYHYDASHHLLVSQDLPVMGQVVQATPALPYLCVRLDVSRSALTEMAQHLSPPRSTAAIATNTRGLYVGRNTVELLDPLLRLLRLLDTRQHLNALAPLAIQELLYRLLSGADGAQLAQTVAGGQGSQRLAQAIAWLRQRYTEPLSIEAMAAAAHMSPSSLHHHFKAVTAMSPLQYQKRLRLHEARRLLLGGGIDAATAAHRVGYQSPSQFSREYSRLFGAPPARDLRELRERELLR